MSFWIRTKDKDGRSKTLLVDFPVVLPLAVTVALGTQVFFFYYNQPTRLGWHGMGMMVGGLVALVAAKANRFRQGEWRSWGPGGMTKPYRVLYFTAYLLMAIGLGMSLMYLIGNV